MPTSASVFDALETTSAAVARIADSIPDWSMDTPAAGWTVGHQIAHLTWTDEVSLVAATDGERFTEILTSALANPVGFVDEGAETVLGEPDLRARWDRSRVALSDALRSAEPGAQLPWFGPPMRPATMANARLMETWAHGLDIADAAGVDLDAPQALEFVAKIGYKTRDFAYLINSQAAPPEPFDVVLTAPDGTEIAFGPGDAAQRVSGSLADFCRLVTQRVHRDDTDLVADGADAAHWLTIAQCFAGAPGSGRAPSSAENESAGGPQ